MSYGSGGIPKHMRVGATLPALQQPEVDSPSSYPQSATSGYNPYQDPIQYGALDRGTPGSGQSSFTRKQSSRINLGQMPRPDRPQLDIVYHTRSGSSRRNPPSVNSLYIAVDTGNCAPRYVRSTLVAPPSTPQLLAQTALPLALHVTPFARPEDGEDPVPVIKLDQAPPRCRRCNAYINPQTTFTQSGQNWTCALCTHSNVVPDW